MKIKLTQGQVAAAADEGLKVWAGLTREVVHEGHRKLAHCCAYSAAKALDGLFTAEAEKIGESVIAFEGNGVPWTACDPAMWYTGEVVAHKLATASALLENVTGSRNHLKGIVSQIKARLRLRNEDGVNRAVEVLAERVPALEAALEDLMERRDGAAVTAAVLLKNDDARQRVQRQRIVEDVAEAARRLWAATLVVPGDVSVSSQALNEFGQHVQALEYFESGAF